MPFAANIGGYGSRIRRDDSEIAQSRDPARNDGFKWLFEI
jgi:hypothetical protein